MVSRQSSSTGATSNEECAAEAGGPARCAAHAITGATATSESIGVKFNWSLSERSYFNTEANLFRIHFYDRVVRIDLAQIQLTDPTYAPPITRDPAAAQLAALCYSSRFYRKLTDCLTQPRALVDLTLRTSTPF